MNCLLLFVLSAVVAASAHAQRGEVIIPAADIAKADQRADTPTPGKWWLNRNAKDWGARDGTILMAGEPSKEPWNPSTLW